MDKINAGEYVKTIDGLIGIFVKYSSRKDSSFYKSHFNCFIKLQKRKTNLQCCREYIINHSFNIYELIEEGDIVEWEWKEFGYDGINEVINRFGTIGVYPIEYDDVVPLKYIKIKKILTKEQFKRDYYVLEEEK